MTILCIGAHPADSVDLAGGTLYQHRKQGGEVWFVTMTTGERSHVMNDYEIKGMNVVSDKKLEFEKSAITLGIDSNNTIFWHNSDEPFIMTPRMVEELVSLIRRLKPDTVITHHPNEYAHWDHAECGKLVCRSLKSAMKLPGKKYWVPTVYFFGVQFRPENARIGVVPQSPDVLIDISDVIGTKIKALMCFESQGYNDRDMLLDRVDSFESEMGRADGLRYSEGFILYHPLKRKLLPVNLAGGFYNNKKEEGI